jgi:hypothetical protein
VLRASRQPLTSRRHAEEWSVSRSEASTRLAERVQKGRELQSCHIRSLEYRDRARAEYWKWAAFNHELLTRLFTTDALAEEYIRVYGAAVRRNPSPAQRVESYREDVADGVHRLESIVERLELQPEPAAAQAT